MATVKKTKVTKKKIVTDTYTASIKIFGRVFASTGASLQEVLENLKPGKTGGICVLTITHGDKTREKILNAGQLFRIFSASKTLHEMALKQVMMLFGDI